MRNYKSIIGTMLTFMSESTILSFARVSIKSDDIAVVSSA